MEKLDWTTFSKRISINASKEVIFNSWTTQNNLEKWFLSQAQFYTKDKIKKDKNSQIEVGDIYEWMWHGSETLDKGEILATNGQDYLEFTFIGCVVSVQVKTEDDENILVITQREIPLDEKSRMNLYVGCTSGWTFYAANLKSMLEGGIDLRNKNIELVDVINT